MVLRFETWLHDQQYREDSVGHLARASGMHNVIHKPSRRKPDEHKNWVDVVVTIAGPGYIDGFNDAWQEYLLAKQTANDFPG
jgi:hypothetical protein